MEALLTLRDRIRREALELGFDVVGFARAEELGVEHDRYRAFVERGRFGTMGYLAEHVETRRRLDNPGILEGARTVVCVGRRYARAPELEQADSGIVPTIARYARGQDYHKHLRRRLRRLAAFVRTLGDGVAARPLLDVEPVMERVWAARAGIGFVGKNGLVITPGQGSYQLLGEVVTTLELPADAPIAERCGSCTRCLDACPTGAFVAPFVLDPRRCIAYLTIETPDAPAQELRASMGEHLFGCDVCQEVCPFNRTQAPEPDRTRPFHPHARWRMGLADLVGLDPDGWDAISEGSPLRRAGRAGIARNAAIVAANRLARPQAAAEARADAERALAAAAGHDDPTVRDVAAWGRARTR